MKNKIKYTEEFNKYWEQYGELHASFCNGDIKLFAFEIWESAKENAKSNKNNRGKCDFCKKERHELREVEMNGEIKHYCMGCIALLCEIIPPAK